MRTLTVVQANLWRENPRIGFDLGLLADTRAHVIGINEGANYTSLLRNVRGYQLVIGNRGPDDRPERQNPILLRDDLRLLDSGTRTMSEAVGISPGRTATFVCYDHHGVDRAHIATHANSHVQGRGGPIRLPRLREYVDHMRRLTVLIVELRASGYAITLSGDLNWGWSKAPARWRWAPKNVLHRAGMDLAWGHHTAPSWNRRRIDYHCHDPRNLTIVGQRLIRGEHSDHPWPEISYRIKEQ